MAIFTLVKNICSILLSIVLLFQSVGISVNDITRFDDFIEHAMLHSEKYGDSIFVFISKHYGELKAQHHQEHQEEHQDHEQLPFEQSASTNSTIPLFLSASKQDFNPLAFSDLETHYFFYKASSSSTHLIDVYHPPKLA